MKIIGFQKTLETSDAIALVLDTGEVLAGEPKHGGAWVCSGTEDEIGELRLAVHAGNTLELAEALRRLITEYPDTKHPDRGKPRTATYYADQITADVRGVNVQSVRVARTRRKKGGGKAPAAEAETVQVAAFETLGQDLEADWLEPVAKTQALLARAVSRLSSAKGALTEVAKLGVMLDDHLGALKLELDVLTRRMREAIPRSLCPACKALEGYMGDCATCLGSGWVGESVTPDTLPDELYDSGATYVLHNGELIAVSGPEDDFDPLAELG